jgi:hypothetical protein
VLLGERGGLKCGLVCVSNCYMLVGENALKIDLGLKLGDSCLFTLIVGFSLNLSKLFKFSAKLRVLFEEVILLTFSYLGSVDGTGWFFKFNSRLMSAKISLL